MSRLFFSFLLGRRRLARLLKCYLFIFRIGPGVGVGVGADKGPGDGVGFGTAPPRSRTPDCRHAQISFLGLTEYVESVQEVNLPTCKRSLPTYAKQIICQRTCQRSFPIVKRHHRIKMMPIERTSQCKEKPIVFIQLY